MNFAKLQHCLCELETRVRLLEAGGGVGSGINWREAWDGNTVSYAFGDAVIYDDPDDTNGANAYYCTADHVSDLLLPPPGNTNWVLMVQGGADGATGPAGATGPSGPAGAAGASADSSYHGLIEVPTNKTYVIVLYCDTAGTITAFTHKTASGTLTANVQINGVSVTGLSAVAVSNVETTTNPSGGNTYAVGDTIQIVVTAASSPLDFQFSLLS